jgi:hypothetical protein
MSGGRQGNGKDPKRVVKSTVSAYGGSVLGDSKPWWACEFMCGANCARATEQLREKGFKVEREQYSNRMSVEVTA